VVKSRTVCAADESILAFAQRRPFAVLQLRPQYRRIGRYTARLPATVYSRSPTFCAFASNSLMTDRPRAFSVRVEPLGQSFEAPDSLTILEAAGFANLRLPRSCRNGTCRTCLCKMTAGRVRYTIEWPGLSREEKAEGYILPCVAIAETDVVIEAPDAVE
jgi:ferredoxin